ncbi:hypothetical protein D9757_008803 [Collybiopsis confluens]|uniref:DUF6534 domain-containing protein n=1 Tax=Collybiopsis confluens TaxID=2823264 RepID=A0A8H5H5G5_9AGAR|nr:hypothetical protein D9757_008803 [Collybiopsis confluens]
MWHYLITNYGNPFESAEIYPTIPVGIIMTALITLSVNSFYGWRIFKLSKHNWWLTGSIAFLSLARVALALASASEMFKLKTFLGFLQNKILFTSGLSVSVLTDIVISAARYHYLKALKQGYSQTQELVDRVVIFTVNDGVLTCAVVIVCIAFWLGMPYNFVYMAIYFTVSKFYSNSVLATLNLRNWHRHQYAWPGRALGLSMMQPTAIRERGARDSETILPVPADSAHINKSSSPDLESGRLEVEVFVARQVEYDASSLSGNADEAVSHSNN